MSTLLLADQSNPSGIVSERKRLRTRLSARVRAVLAGRDDAAAAR